MADSHRTTISCPICLSWRLPIKVLDCGHSFCFRCLVGVQTRNWPNLMPCPTCRKLVLRSFSDLPTNLSLQRALMHVDEVDCSQATSVADDTLGIFEERNRFAVLHTEMDLSAASMSMAASDASVSMGMASMDSASLEVPLPTSSALDSHNSDNFAEMDLITARSSVGALSELTYEPSSGSSYVPSSVASSSSSEESSWYASRDLLTVSDADGPGGQNGEDGMSNRSGVISVVSAESESEEENVVSILE